MAVQRSEYRVESGDAVVVEQQPYPYATVGRVPEFLEQEQAGDVVMPDVVLEVERTLGVARQQHPRGKRLARIVQQVHAAQPGIRPSRVGQRLAHAGVGGVGQCDRHPACFQRGQACAA